MLQQELNDKFLQFTKDDSLKAVLSPKKFSPSKSKKSTLSVRRGPSLARKLSKTRMSRLDISVIASRMSTNMNVESPKKDELLVSPNKKHTTLGISPERSIMAASPMSLRVSEDK